jgi:hypothetical protein
VGMDILQTVKFWGNRKKSGKIKKIPVNPD